VESECGGQLGDAVEYGIEDGRCEVASQGDGGRGVRGRLAVFLPLLVLGGGCGAREKMGGWASRWDSGTRDSGDVWMRAVAMSGKRCAVGKGGMAWACGWVMSGCLG
jgi:hypothetical protein